MISRGFLGIEKETIHSFTQPPRFRDNQAVIPTPEGHRPPAPPLPPPSGWGGLIYGIRCGEGDTPVEQSVAC